jgi:ribokinase
MGTMTSDFDVVVVGGANSDYLVRGKTLPKPGTTIEGEEFQEAAGGKGANQAVAAARLGAKVAFVGRVGADPRGQAILSKLKDEHVDVREVSVDANAPTGVALVMVDGDGEKQIMTAPGANRRLSAKDISRAAGVISNGRVVLLQLEVSMLAVEAAVRIAKAAGAKVVLDPAPARELADDLLRNVEVIRPNAAEAEVISGVRVTDEQTALQAAENLIRRGVRAAIIGAPGGNLLVSTNEELWLPHVEVDVVDATGAGDAFAAALAVCLARGEDLAAAVRFANAAAALKATKLGAQAGLPRRDEVDRLVAHAAPVTL